MNKDTLSRENSEELRKFLSNEVNAFKRLSKNTNSRMVKAHYWNMSDFIAREGISFDHFSPRENRYIQRQMKQCFYNSRCVVGAAKGKLTYVEGYCYTGLIPIHHAWAIDENNGVVDTTLHGHDAYAYVGIPFRIEYVREITSYENCSVIDQWQHGFPLLVKSLKENQDAIEWKVYERDH